MAYKFDKDYINLDFQNVIPGDLSKSYGVFRFYLDGRTIEEDTFIFRVVDPAKQTATGFAKYYPVVTPSASVPNGFEYDQVNAAWYDKEVQDQATPANNYLIAGGPTPFLITYSSARMGSLNWLDIIITFPYGVDPDTLLPNYEIHVIDIKDMDITDPANPIPNEPATIDFSICQDVNSLTLLPYRAPVRSEVVNVPLRQLWQMTNYLDCKLNGFTDQASMDLGVIATFCGTDIIIQNEYKTLEESMSIELIATSPNAKIYYTTDENAAPLNLYTGCINISSFEEKTFYIKYQAKLESLGVMSQVFILKVVLAPKHLYITPSPVAGDYFTSQTITLAGNFSNARIYYTLDGTTPIWTTDGSAAGSTILYTDETGTLGSGPFTLSSTTTVRYGGYLPDIGSIAPNGSATYNIDTTALVISLSPASGTYSPGSPVSVDISVSQGGIAINSELEVSYNGGSWTSIGNAPASVSIDGSLGDLTDMQVRTSYSGKSSTALGQYELAADIKMEIEICGPQQLCEDQSGEYYFILFKKLEDGTRIDVTGDPNYQVSYTAGLSPADPDFIGSGTLIGSPNASVNIQPDSFGGLAGVNPLTNVPVDFEIRAIAKDLNGIASNSNIANAKNTYFSKSYQDNSNGGEVLFATSPDYDYHAHTTGAPAGVSSLDMSYREGGVAFDADYFVEVYQPSGSRKTTLPTTADWSNVFSYSSLHDGTTNPVSITDSGVGFENIINMSPWNIVVVKAEGFNAGAATGNSGILVITMKSNTGGPAPYMCSMQSAMAVAGTGNCHSANILKKMFDNGTALTTGPGSEIEVMESRVDFEYEYRVLVSPGTVRDYTTSEPWVDIIHTLPQEGVDDYLKALSITVNDDDLLEVQTRVSWHDYVSYASHIIRLNDSKYNFTFTPNIDDGPFESGTLDITEINGPATYGGFGVDLYYRKSSSAPWTLVANPIAGLTVTNAEPDFDVKAEALDHSGAVMSCPTTQETITYAFTSAASFSVNPPTNGEQEIAAPVISGASQVFTSGTSAGEIWYMSSAEATEVNGTEPIKSAIFRNVIEILTNNSVPMPSGTSYVTWGEFYAGYKESSDISGLIIAVNAMPNDLIRSEFTQDMTGISVTLHGSSGGDLEAVWVNIDGTSTKYGVRYRNPISSLMDSTDMGTNVYLSTGLKNSSEWNTVELTKGAWNSGLIEFPCWSIKKTTRECGSGGLQSFYSLTTDDVMSGVGGTIAQYQYVAKSATAFKINGEIQLESTSYTLTKSGNSYSNSVGMTIVLETTAIPSSRITSYENGYAYYSYVKFSAGSSLPESFADELRIRFELNDGNFSAWYTFKVFMPSATNATMYADAVAKWGLIPWDEYNNGTKEKDMLCIDVPPLCPPGTTPYYSPKLGFQCLPYTVDEGGVEPVEP